MTNSNSNKNYYEVIFSPETTFIIGELIKKYGFEKIQEEMMEKMEQAETSEEKEKIFENLPGRQIARTVKELAQEKISAKNFISLLKQRLNISEELAKDLAMELEEKVLVLAQKISIEEKETLPSKETEEEVSFPEKLRAEPSEIKPPPSEEKPSPKKPDIYREPAE